MEGVGRSQQDVESAAAVPARRLPGHDDPLARERPGAPLQRARPVRVARPAPAHLAARGLEHGAGAGQHDGVGGDPQCVGHALENLPPHPLPPLRFGGARLRHHHQPLGAQGRVGDPEGGDAALAHAVDAVDHRLRLVRVDVAPGLDDDVLPPSRQEQLAAGQVAEVARVEPPVAGGDGPGRVGVAVVTRHRRRAAELHPSLEALAEGGAGLVGDPQLVPRQGGAARDERQRLGPGARLGPAGGPELRSDPIDEGRVAPRGHREPHRALGEPVDRPQGVGP